MAYGKSRVRDPEELISCQVGCVWMDVMDTLDPELVAPMKEVTDRG